MEKINLFVENNNQFYFSLIFFILSILIINFFSKKLFINNIRGLNIFFWHTFLCLIYYYYTSIDVADSDSYYIDALDINQNFKVTDYGSNFIRAFLQFVLKFFDVSYLGFFLIFNLIGTIGLLYLDSSFKFVTTNANKIYKIIASCFVFIPSINFWSSAIGKDAISMLSVGIILWSVINIKSRLIPFFFAAGIMLLIRPHISTMVIISFFIATFIDFKQFKLIYKIFLLFTLILIIYWLLPQALEISGVMSRGDLYSFNINLYVEKINEFISSRKPSDMYVGTSTQELSNYDIIFNFLTYFFRPLIFEGTNIFSFYVSIENSILLILFLYLLTKISKTKINGPFFKFIIIFSIVSALLLIETSANLGINNRQKWMVLPFIYFLLLSVAKNKKI